jgi:hypothetical protein
MTAEVAEGQRGESALDLDRPIIIVGPHRSGTTLLYGLLAQHRDLGWFDGFDQRFPRSPFLARWLRRLGLGATRDPHEAQHLWDLAMTADDDRLSRADATPRWVSFYRWRVAATLRERARTRFLAKYPRLSLRLDWLDALFPGATFVHMVRDWRAVVCSTVERKRKRARREERWFGVRVPGWRELGGLGHELAAGRIYRAVSEALEDAAPRYGARFVRASYEELCRDPRGTIDRVCEACGLARDAGLLDGLPPSFTSANDKWRTGLDPAAVEAIRAESPAFFARYEP